MFPKHRHTPIFDAERKRCPVCHRAVYSLAGAHPQCAIKRTITLESRTKRQAASKASPEIAVVTLRTDAAFREEASQTGDSQFKMTVSAAGSALNSPDCVTTQNSLTRNSRRSRSGETGCLLMNSQGPGWKVRGLSWDSPHSDHSHACRVCWLRKTLG